jgi:hypothetical protein
LHNVDERRVLIESETNALHSTAATLSRGYIATLSEVCLLTARAARVLASAWHPALPGGGVGPRLCSRAAGRAAFFCGAPHAAPAGAYAPDECNTRIGRPYRHLE